MSNREENSQNDILKYDAFVSYRHCELDHHVAVNIQRKLENFKFPKSVLPKLKGEKTKISRVFRDEDELPLSDCLSEQIDLALSNSEYLIVICTPRLPQSKWCLREIEMFLQTHDRKHILLVLAEGEPEESFPEILRYENVEVTDENGNTHIEKRDMEPLAADARGDNKKEINRAIDGAIIKLVAVMFGLNYDDLKQRHREQRLKKMFAVWSAISVAILIFAFVCLGLFTVILKQRNEIKDRYAGTVADAAAGLLEDGRRKDAIYVLRSVLDMKEQYNVDVYRQMIYALDLYALGEEYIPLRNFSIPSIITDYKLSANNGYLAVGGLNGDYHIIDTKEDEIIYSFESFPIGWTHANYGFDGETGIIYICDDGVFYADLIGDGEKKLYETNSNILSDPNCDITNILVDDKFVGYKNGEIAYETDMESYSFNFDDLFCVWFCYSLDGEHVLFALDDYSDSWILQYNTGTGEEEFALQTDVSSISSYATDGRRIYIARDNYREGYLPVDSTLCIIDTDYPDDINTVNIPLIKTRDILPCDAGICITTNNLAIMLDENDYSIIDRTEGIYNIINAFRYKSGVGIVDINGSFFVFDEDSVNGIDMSIDLFGIVPRSTVNQVIFQNDKFYYYFADNYIVEYVDNPKAVKQTEVYRDFNYEEALSYGESAEEVLVNINDIASEYVYSSVYSNDKKHIAVMMCDKTMHIYNGDTYELEKVEYGIDNALLISFVYIEEAGIYILNTGSYAYILDSEFNYITDIDCCVGFEDGCFIVIYNDEYYKLKLFSYEEVLQLADEEIEGYTPDQAIMDKYIVEYN